VSEQQKTAGYKVVPVEPTAEMREAGHRAAWRSIPSLFDEDDAANVYRSMLAAAPKPPVLSDERIMEIFVDYHREDKTVRDFARAIEREILGRLGMTEVIDVAIATEKGGA